MKIRIKQTCKLLPHSKHSTFHKGRVYSALVATNQPNWKEKGKVFAIKQNGAEILLQRGEYEIVGEKGENHWFGPHTAEEIVG